MNKAQIIGNLCRNPEVRALNNGDRVMNLSVATNKSWRDKTTGEKVEKAEFHNVAIFQDRVITYLEKYAEKGTLVYVEGELRTRKWTDQSGNDRYTTEIVIEKFGGDAKILTGWRENGGQRGGGGHSEPAVTERELDDDIPFATMEGIW